MVPNPTWLYQPHVITNSPWALAVHGINSKLLSPSIKVLTFPSMTFLILTCHQPSPCASPFQSPKLSHLLTFASPSLAAQKAFSLTFPNFVESYPLRALASEPARWHRHMLPPPTGSPLLELLVYRESRPLVSHGHRPILFLKNSSQRFSKYLT